MTNYIGKDQNTNNASTTYWFDVDGETFGVVESCGETSFVDCDGYPTSKDTICQADRNILDALETAVTDEMRAE